MTAELGSREWFLEEYVKGGKSYREIANILGVSIKTVSNRIKAFGIVPHPAKILVDLTGKKFGRLTVKSRGQSEHSISKWICECECGKIVEVYGNSLTQGTTASCGCYRIELMFKGFGDLSGCYWNRIAKGAITRNLPFNIAIEDAWNKYISQDRKCALSGLDIKIVRDYSRKHADHTASLDRIDNSIGYEVSNIQWIHRDINVMKNNFEEEYFIHICKSVASHRK